MASRRPTQSDVARLAGVSRGTVSLVLNERTNGPVPISDATRDKVLAAARQLGYAPNPVAQMLVHGSNRLIGIFSYETVFPYDKNDFFFPYLSGIQQEASEQDFNVLLFTRNHNRSKPHIYHNGMNMLRLADGSILLGANPDRGELRQLVEEGYPFVYIGRREVPGCEISWVANDYKHGSAQATRHLLELGHERLGFVGPEPSFEPQEDKLAGCRQTLMETGRGELVVLPECPPEAGEVLIHAIETHHLTALLCDSHKTFIESLHILQKHGLSVPDDCSVVCLTTVEHSQPFQLKPTFVQLNRHMLGITATQLLTRQIAGDNTPPHQAIIPCELVIGETTAPPRPQPQQ